MIELDVFRAWAEEAVRQRVRRELIAFFAMLMFAAAALLFTTFVVFGLLLMFGIVLAVAGIRPPHPSLLAPLILAAQLIVFYAIKPKDVPVVSAERTEDTGELIIVKSDRALRARYFYNQEHGFSLRQTILTLLLAVAIAIHEAIQHARTARLLWRTNFEDLASLSYYLTQRGNRADLAAIQHDLPEIDLLQIVPRLYWFSGFILRGEEPQGIAITDDAVRNMLVGEPDSH
jgi:hypothetical protein